MPSVHRRRVLALSASALAISAAGCLESLADDGTPAIVTGTELAVNPDDVEARFSDSDGNGDEEFVSHEDPPEVTVDGSEIEIVGALVIGSSTCKTVGIDRIEHDEETDRLTVAIADVDDREDGVDCTADAALASYRAIVSLERPIDQLRVIESGTEGERRITVSG